MQTSNGLPVIQHPVNRSNSIVGNSERIRVNSIEFNYVIGHDTSLIHVVDCGRLKVGSQVEIFEKSVLEDRPSGRSVIRYIAAIEPLCALLDDDDAIAVVLVPTRSMLK